MKFIRTIIAFAFIYLFVALVGSLIIFMIWLSRFIPDMPRQTIANIDSTDSGTTMSYKSTSPVSALETIFTRGQLREGTSTSIASTKTNTLFVTYTRIQLPDWLVPLGYNSLYRLNSISTADRKEISVHRDDWIDSLMEQLFPEELQSKREITVVAKDTQSSYTVVVSSDGINTYED